MSIREYVWGDRELAFYFCTSCGCATHWKSIKESGEMGVNTRMMEPDDVRFVNRKLDFAALRTPVRSKESAHAEDKAQY